MSCWPMYQAAGPIDKIYTINLAASVCRIGVVDITIIIYVNKGDVSSHTTERGERVNDIAGIGIDYINDAAFR